MKKITATLAMGLLLAFSVIAVSAQDDMKQDSMKTRTMKHHHHKMMKHHHHKMMKHHHHKMMKHHRHHRKMMKKSM